MKTKQFIVCILVILSLFASSAAACICSHHEEKVDTSVSSCHQHSEHNRTEQKHNSSAESVNSEIECCCFEVVSKINAKPGTIKFEKLVRAASGLEPVKIALVSRIAAPKISFSKPLYLSDSFYNLAPGRAPPVL